MSSTPKTPARIEQMLGSPFAALAGRIQALEGKIYPLHIGDSWIEPLASARMERWTSDKNPGLHRYASPQGRPDLLAEVAKRYDVAAQRVLVTAGATGGLSNAAQALLEPDDEVLIPAPYWPLIRGIVQVARCRPVEIPFFAHPKGEQPACEQPDEIVRQLEARITERSKVLYINSPNNPTGRVLSRAAVEAMCAVATKHNLWIWSDETYERVLFRGEHVSPADIAPERTFRFFTFSKAYGLAGQRVGYTICPNAELRTLLQKAGTHTVYCAPNVSQLAALEALRNGADWVKTTNASYLEAGSKAAAALGLDAPEAGTFLFVDISAALDKRGIMGFISDAIDRNLLLAPGSSFGADYANYLRVCFTSVDPQTVAQGVEILRDMLERN